MRHQKKEGCNQGEVRRLSLILVKKLLVLNLLLFVPPCQKIMARIQVKTPVRGLNAQMVLLRLYDLVIWCHHDFVSP